MTKGFDLLKTLNGKYIPLVKNGKAPAVAFKDKTFTQQELNEHYKQGGNFGLLCEHKFFVIDIDVSHGTDGMANFIKWLVEHNFDPKKVIDGTLASQTATGGFHLIYRQDENHNFKQNIGFIDGVDIKASANNFIVVAPSRINGKAYRFINEDKFESIPVVPSKLIELMQAESKQRAKKKPTKETQEKTGLTFTNAFGARIMDVGYYLTRGFGNVGERNDNLFKWAIQARKSMTQESALNFALIANEHSDTPIEDEQEIDRTIDSAYQYEVNNTVPELPKIDTSNIEASIFND